MPRLDFLPDTALVDEEVLLVASGLRPQEEVTLRFAATVVGQRYTSHATFLADNRGTVNLASAAPIRGTYAGTDPMGFFWSMVRDTTQELLPGPPPGLDQEVPRPDPVQVTAEVDGHPVASGVLWRRYARDDVRARFVRENGIVATFYEPPGPGPHPAVLVLGGSSGRIPHETARLLASHGYAALAAAYFGTEPLPPSLSLIPLEYFGTCLRWLRGRTSVDGTSLAILGTSRGGELALLLAATYPDVKAVVAYVPSHVVWRGCCDSVSMSRSAWTWRSEPLPFVPELEHERIIDKYPRNSAPLPLHRFLANLGNTEAVERAAIPVERIRGAVLLISGRDDKIWPSTHMAEQVVARLKRYGFSYPYAHISYEDAGHAIGQPYRPTTALPTAFHPVFRVERPMGGTPAGYARAEADSWQHVLRFFSTNLSNVPSAYLQR